ncbi:uncharacterized protein LY89DRAFT_783417 [Mollisia scopiformis]|uniref:SH3 domain-containing protein n=1 Tax=Mollisia scopiformis TaxID=149040 RepID=A0A194X4X5_MOLSC|nr:uncharacterized protein LY89DRAFT_783417 [Mollisia scopiformis]KUJ15228.1 hypothetical protein LY89DRAFT_783417 [Mollisia scopiformis]
MFFLLLLVGELPSHPLVLLLFLVRLRGGCLLYLIGESSSASASSYCSVTIPIAIIHDYRQHLRPSVQRKEKCPKQSNSLGRSISPPPVLDAQTPVLIPVISSMDPLTVIGAVGGLIKTAAFLSSTTSRIVSARNKGSHEIVAVKNTVDIIRSVLQQLQILLLKQGNIDPERASMLFVGDIVAILTSCVLTMSNLEGCIKGLKVDDKLKLIDSIRWNSRMSEVRKYRGELESSKISLNLVLTIMTCQSVQSAEISATELKVLVVRVLEGNHDLSKRMSIMQKSIVGSIYSSENHDTVSLADTTTGLDGTSNDPLPVAQPNLRHPVIRAFEEELNSSWVYQKSRGRRARARPFSMSSSAQLTQTWSVLSGLSLSEISNISVWALPIQREDLVNSEMYWSENEPSPDFDLESPASYRKEPNSVVGSHLPQLPDLLERNPMLEHSDEHEQAPDKMSETSELLHQSETVATTSANEATQGETEDYLVLYVVASLFDFHLDLEKVEAGYTWLSYNAGDVFDVIGEKGELWLAVNQDDSQNKVGWLWSKHCAILPPEDLKLGDAPRRRQIQVHRRRAQGSREHGPVDLPISRVAIDSILKSLTELP